MAEVLDWQNGSNQRAVLDMAVQALREGRLVAFPTDTTYRVVASVLEADAVDRLVHLQPGQDAALTLALPSAAHALDWAPEMSPLARRLARRCWPGPVTLEVNEGVAGGLAARLPETVRQHICREGSLSLYVPGHEALASALLHLPAPLVLHGAGSANGAQAFTVDQVVETYGAAVALVLDDGPRRCTERSTAIRVSGDRWIMLQEGVVTADEVSRKTTCVILFVCTGNTCRSPMAAALCRKLLAERLQCSPQELPQRGYLVYSAGLAAMPGGLAAPEAIEAVKEFGADLSDHLSMPLTADLVLQADYLLTMTEGHQVAVAARYSPYGPQPQLLNPEGHDITDPVGADQETYRACARQIQQYLEKFVSGLNVRVEA